jgi:hypothetical protein
LGAGREPVTRSPELSQLVDEAYTVFACLPPDNLGVCTACCMNPEDERTFLSQPVRSIPPELIDEWLSAAFLNETFSTSVTKYLAPRLLDLLSLENQLTHERELVLERGLYGRRDLWPGRGGEILDQFRFQFLETYRGDAERPDFLDDVICMFTLSLFPVTYCIAQFSQWSDEDLVGRLWVDWCSGTRIGQIWETAFWEVKGQKHAETIDEQHTVLRNWLTGDELRSRLDGILERAEVESVLWSRAADLEVVLGRGLVRTPPKLRERIRKAFRPDG